MDKAKVMKKMDAALFEKAVALARLVVQRADETQNCGVCSGDEDTGVYVTPHESDCPVPLARELLSRISAEKSRPEKG